MTRIRRAAVTVLALVCSASVGIEVHAAEFYPSKPVRLVVPFEAGGTMDVLGRIVAAQITKQSGTNIYIDNRPGANSVIGTAYVANSAPDGYTVLNVSPSLVINPLVQAKLPYAVENFIPVTALGIGTGYLIVVRKDLTVKSIAELTALAAKKDNGLTYGTPGVGNALHLASEFFANKVGVKMLHVPYKGSASALSAIMAGQVDVMLLSSATVIPVAASGHVRVVGFTGEARSKEFPNVPTMKESGVDNFVIKGTWVGWFVPAGTPTPIVAKLHQEVTEALKNPQVTMALSKGGFEPDGSSPADFARFVKAEYVRYGEVLKGTGIKAE